MKKDLQIKTLVDFERKRAIQAVMNLFFALREIKGTPTLKDLVKLAKRIKGWPYSSSHTWGSWPDEWFSQVGQAADEIGEFCRRWGRIQVNQSKEKYGSVRVYCHFGLYNLNCVFYPGYHYIQEPRRLMNIRIPAWISTVFFPYQKFIYRLAYKRALKKYPMIHNEILCCADYDEFLEGL